MIRRTVIGFAMAVPLFFAASPTWAQAKPVPAELAAALAGNWTGTLAYRDYQSDKMFELPLKTEIRPVGDGVTVVQFSTFDDGPRVGAVRITTSSMYDIKAETLRSVSFRKGNPVALSSETVSLEAYTDPTHWSVRYEENGSDDEVPAKLRTTETRDGDTLTSVKEVLPASATDGKWRFRNRTQLKRDNSVR